MGLLSIPPIMFIILGCLLHETKVPRYRRFNSQVGRNVAEASKKMWNTFKSPVVWKPALYMFLSWALCPDISEGLFFFYTDPFMGLAFSQAFIGIMYAIGAIGALVGVLTYRNLLRGLSFRYLLFWVQMVISVFGMLDFILVTHFNLRLGMSNHLFAVLDESFSRATDRLKYTPLFVLCAKLCPSGIEGTFFALLVSIDNVGLRFSSWGGGLLLELLQVTRNHFQNLWMAILIRNGLRLSPLLLLFLVPNKTPDVDIIPCDLLGEQEANASDEQNLAYRLLMPEAEHVTQSK
ncbi:hypothetical protein O6H91_Y363400 [Diphasiastrum complanatum]|nr:hypothetical protein O6H91_Y363400 [Diphasiastrum complanatum]